MQFLVLLFFISISLIANSKETSRDSYKKMPREKQEAEAKRKIAEYHELKKKAIEDRHHARWLKKGKKDAKK